MGLYDTAKSWLKTLTGNQSAPAPGGMAGGFNGGQLNGYGEALPACVDTYRMMRNHPVVAICRAASTASIRGSEFSIEADEDAPADAKDFIEKMMTPLWPIIKADGLYALDYGWAPFEKIYTLDDDGYYSLARLKPLNVKLTEIDTEKNGDYTGLKQGKIELPAEKTWLFTHDGETGNLYGRSRHENIREHAWSPWINLIGKQGRVFEKLAAIVPIIRYPEGSSKDANGVTRSNYEIACGVLTNLMRGAGVAMPNSLAPWADDLLRAGGDPAQLAAWMITFLEADGSAAAPTLAALQHFEDLMMYGWFTPPGGITNTQVGSQAKSVANVDLCIAMQEQVKTAMVSSVNTFVIDDVLVMNWGEGARGTVRLVTPPLADAVRDGQRRIIETILSGQSGVQLLEQATNLEDAIRDTTGFKKPETETDTESATVPDMPGDGSLPEDPAAPAAPVTADATGTPNAGVASDTALTGIAATTAADLCTAVSNGQQSPDVAVLIIKGLGFSEADAQKMVDAAKAFTPAKPNEPVTVPAAPAA